MFLLLFFFITGVVRGGKICALNSQCPSNVCLTYCCSAKVEECLECNTDGGCKLCNEGFKLEQGKCTPTHLEGSTCPCLGGGRCIDGVCCQKNISEECIGCHRSGGSCMGCKDGFYLSLTRQCLPMKKAGQLCEFFTKECLCRDRCCIKEEEGCGRCGLKGECIGCLDGYSWKGGRCLPTSLRDGRPCKEDGECLHNRCQKGKCCSSYKCLQCSKYGTCLQCQPGSYLNEAGVCESLEGFKCAKRTNMAYKRYCRQPQKKGERCCWFCQQPCQEGLRCTRTSPSSGICK